jgi:peroxiredoxin
MNFKNVPIFVCAVALLLCAAPTTAQQSGSSPKERKPSPSLEVQTVDGKVVKVHQMRGKVVLVDFMTTVCPTCKLASVGLQKLYRDLGPKGFRPVAVALNVDSAAPLKDYMREHELTFTFGTAPRGDVATYLSHPPDRPMHVPTIVLLDRRGRVCSVEVGWNGEELLRNQIVKLLSE